MKRLARCWILVTAHGVQVLRPQWIPTVHAQAGHVWGPSWHISGPQHSVPGAPSVVTTTDVPRHRPVSRKYVLLSPSALGAPVSAESVRKAPPLSEDRGGGVCGGRLRIRCLRQAVLAGLAGDQERNQTAGMGLAGNRSL